MTHWTNNATRWGAVQRRDPNADGAFVYAVRTTRIYCRPVCKARLARRANVVFYDKAMDAESGGFRPCKRCKPQSGIMPEAAAAERVRLLLERELRSPLRSSSDDMSRTRTKSTECLARQAQVSKWHFHRVFKKIAGVTPSEYIRRRLQAGPDPSSTAPTPLSSTPMNPWGALELAEEPLDSSKSDDVQDRSGLDVFDMIDWSALAEPPHRTPPQTG